MGEHLTMSRAKPDPPPLLPSFLPRVLRLSLLRLRNLAFQYHLRHHPPLRIRIRAACMNRVHANVQNVPATEALR